MSFICFNLFHSEEGRTNVGAEIVDNNLAFFRSDLFINIVVVQPLINKANESVHSTKTNRGLLARKFIDRFDIAVTASCMHLANMVLAILAICLNKAQDSDNATSNI